MNTLKLNFHFLMIICISLFSITACNKNEKVEDKEVSDQKNNITLTSAQMASIKMDTAKFENEETELSLTGEVSFDEDKVKKVFSLVSGNITQVNVSLGDSVRKGQVLAVIKSSDVGEIQSQYEIAINNLQVAQKNLDITNELYKTNVNSQTQLLSAQNEFKRATSEVNKLKQTLSIYGANENSADAQYNVIAPIDGFVVEKNINASMEIRSDNATSLFTVSALNTIWVLADIYESDLSKVKIGDEVEITTIAYPDKIFNGTIKRIGSVLDPDSKVVKARIVLNNSDGLLKPEMFAAVKVHLHQPKKSIAIGSNSVVFLNGNNYVMVFKNKQTFEKRAVNIGHSIANKTYINAGLSVGELVVGEGSLYVASAE